MTVRAHLHNGSTVTLSRQYGTMVSALADKLTEDTLTGSAVPLADALLETDDGNVVRWVDVAEFVEEP